MFWYATLCIIGVSLALLARNYFRHLSFVHDKNIPYPSEFGFWFGDAMETWKAHSTNTEHIQQFRLPFRLFSILSSETGLLSY